MADSTQKRSLLDQLTDSAAQPTLPSILAPATGDTDPSVSPMLSNTAATAPGSTANLESIAASPDTMAGKVAATQQSEQNTEDAKRDDNPSFLKKLARAAGGAVGFTDPSSSPQAALGAKIGSLVGRTGNALAMAEGTPEQKQIAEEQSQIPLKLAQIQNEREYRRGVLGINQQNANTKGVVAATGARTEQDKYAAGDEAMGLPEGTSRMTAEAAQQNAASNEGLRSARQEQIQQSLNGEVRVMPEIAHAIGRDDLVGKTLSPIKYQQQVSNVLKSLGMKPMDLGALGTWGVSPITGKFAKISDSSPSQLAGQRYMNRPVAAINPETNQLEYMSGGDAVASHAAPGSQGAQIMSKQAQFKDIYSGIANMRHAVAGIGQEPLDATTIGKLTAATRETDPTISHQIFDTVLGTENLTPAQQDFVIAVQQLNERALSLRNLAGMGNGSDQMRAAIRATLPNAKSGSAQMMLKQLDSVTNLVDNLYTGVPRINTGSKTSNAVNSSPSGGNTPNGGPNLPKQSFGDWKKAQAGGH